MRLKWFMVAVLFLLAANRNDCLFAADASEQKTAPKNVGGLIFDLDDGVAVEKGGGGSVYMKSNREYMQNKFREIDAKFAALEERVRTLESKTAVLQAPSSQTDTAAKTNTATARVLAS